jgi:phospholipase D-like protein
MTPAQTDTPQTDSLAAHEHVNSIGCSAAPVHISDLRKELLMRQKQWNDLTDTQKRGIVLVGVLQLMLLAAALLDIRRRPANAINGSKRLWRMVVFINLIGPIAYFLFGRKRPDDHK